MIDRQNIAKPVARNEERKDCFGFKFRVQPHCQCSGNEAVTPSQI